MKKNKITTNASDVMNLNASMEPGTYAVILTGVKSRKPTDQSDREIPMADIAFSPITVGNDDKLKNWKSDEADWTTTGVGASGLLRVIKLTSKVDQADAIKAKKEFFVQLDLEEAELPDGSGTYNRKKWSVLTLKQSGYNTPFLRE